MPTKTKPPRGLGPAARDVADRSGGLIEPRSRPPNRELQASRLAVRFGLPVPTARLVADLAWRSP